MHLGYGVHTTCEGHLRDTVVHVSIKCELAHVHVNEASRLFEFFS